MSKVFTQTQAIDFIEKIFGNGRIQNQGKNIQVVCPVCKSFKGSQYSKAKLAIRTDNFLAHCWVCGYKSRSILSLLRKYYPDHVRHFKENFLNAEDLSQIHLEEQDVNRPVFLPDGFRLLAISNSRDNYSTSAKKYLASRGIVDVRDYWYWKIGVTDDPNSDCKYRIIIPSYDEFGNLNYWTGRSWLERAKRDSNFKYKNPDANRRNVIFNENNLDWTKELILVEGPFDLFKCNDNATAVLGSELDANWKLFQKILANKTPVLLAFDNEPKAQEKQFKIAETLSEFDISVRILENPSTERDVGDMTKTEFNTLKQKAKLYSEEYLLRRKIASIV